MQAADSPAKPAKPKSVLSRADRRAFNAGMREKGRHEHVAAVLYPTNRRGEVFSSPQLVIEKLPRSSAGRPPRLGVYIPLLAIAQVRLVRAGKHSRQQPLGPVGRHWERPAKAERKEAA